MDRKASAVLLSWRRTENLPEIVRSLRAVPWIDDVVIWHNDHKNRLTPPFSWPADRVYVHNADVNVYTYGRFMACKFATHDLIVTQDDDVIVRNWGAIREAFQSNPESIAAALDTGHLMIDGQLRWGGSHEVLLGWGAMFDRRWIAGAFEAYVDAYGHDELLHRKADRLFSMLLNRHHTTLRAKFDELPGSRDRDVALYMRDDHAMLTNESRRRALKILEGRT